MAGDPQIVFNVPREIIDAHVKAAVTSALAKDPGELIRHVVECAMAERDSSTYGRLSIWDGMVNKMIRDVARKAFEEWLEEQRAVIAAEVRKQLGGRQSEGPRKKFVDDVVGKLTAALGTFNVRIDLP